MRTQRISQALTTRRNGQRPVYMVLRHLGVEPAAAVHALYVAGFRPAQHGVLCGELTAAQVAKIAQESEGEA